MVLWVGHQARWTPSGFQLAFSAWARVQWQGCQGFQRLRPLQLLFWGRNGPTLNIMILHLGSNNLRQVKGKVLVIQALKDIEFICGKWPGVFIGWSAVHHTYRKAN